MRRTREQAMARAGRTFPKVTVRKRPLHEVSATAPPVSAIRMACVQWDIRVDLMECAQWATVVAAVGRKLDFGQGPEFFESVWPTAVDNTVSSSVGHALAQRSIRHERPNGVREVFDVMRPRDQAIRLVCY